jgi:hypothetical protein
MENTETNLLFKYFSPTEVEDLQVLLNSLLKKWAVVDEIYKILMNKFKPNIKEFQKEYANIYTDLKQNKYKNYHCLISSISLLPVWLLDNPTANIYVLHLLNEKIKQDIYDITLADVFALIDAPIDLFNS